MVIFPFLYSFSPLFSIRSQGGRSDQENKPCLVIRPSGKSPIQRNPSHISSSLLDRTPFSLQRTKSREKEHWSSFTSRYYWFFGGVSKREEWQEPN